MDRRKFKVIITGSNSGNLLAWRFINLLVGDDNIKTIFISPNNIKAIPTSFDGLILSGGVDINPKLYSNKIHKSVKRVEPKRDSMELKLLELATKRDIPILGICRGMQLINIFFGGTLIQDINDLKLPYPHSNTIFPIKRVRLVKNTKLQRILKKSTLYVNSIHHQAVDRVGESLKINAFDRNNIIEGIENSSKKFLIGVQWHPEYIFYKRDSRKLFYSFKDAIIK